MKITIIQKINENNNNPKECSSQCLSCDFSNDNCSTCTWKNRLPPKCSCISDSFEVSNASDCVKYCPSSTFQDSM